MTQRTRVLVVDDNRDMVDSLLALLETEGFLRCYCGTLPAHSQASNGSNAPQLTNKAAAESPYEGLLPSADYSLPNLAALAS